MQIWYSLLFVVSVVQADTPANCSYEDIQGRWILYEGQHLHNNSETCSNALGSVVSKLKVDLKYPDIVIDQFGNTGFWTLVYNQGFEVTVNGRTYFAFSYYEKVEENVTSYCDRTFPGWSHDVTLRHWACFYARKTSAVVKYHKDPFTGIQDTGVLLSVEYMREILQLVNSAHTSWTATVYQDFINMTHVQSLQLRGGSRSWTGSRPATTAASVELLQAVNTLPTSFDWRNVLGVDYVSNVRNQGGCGSCYAFSSTGMLEARIRIQTNNSIQLTLSPQDIVSCSLLSQGCDGGFPYLVAGRYGRDYGVVTETCNPYVGQDSSCPREKCDRVYTASYNYVGGYYGACNEQHIMLALLRGPLSVSFEVYPDFMMYKSGIYQHNTSFYSGFEPFEVVNHAVLLVGYGVDENLNMKYWIVKNSWGSSWGENGYFRIRRGFDECGIESIAVEAVPIP